MVNSFKITSYNIWRNLCKRRTLLFCITLAVMLIVVLGGGLIWHFRPLLKTDDIMFFELNGEQRVPVQVYTRFGFDNEYWLDSPKQVFVFIPDSQIILIPVRLGRRPYLHYNHDMTLGVAIDDKVKWNGEYLSRNERNVIFRSGKDIYEIKL